MDLNAAIASFVRPCDWLPRASAIQLIPGLKSEGTLRNWEASGKAPAHYRIGGRVMYRRSDIEAWVEKRRIEAAAPGANLNALVEDGE